MNELRDLNQIYRFANERIEQYDGKDFVLPTLLKDTVKEINSNRITYNEFSAIIETRGYQNGVLKIYLPNQWFYIASYFTDFYNELQKYKKEALKVVSKERLKELNGKVLSDEELSRLNALSLDESSKNNLIKFITDYSWWFGAKTIDRGDFYVSPILSSARLVNASQSYVADLCAFLADKTELVQAIIGQEATVFKITDIEANKSYIQQIFYGAPGTGKSFTINRDTKGEDVIRTTFHPDTDYSSFVGAYKPTTIEEPVMTVIGTKLVPVENAKPEKKIVYEFVSQAFLQAYVKAWIKYAEAGDDKPKKQYLVIEEINRGNCAQIFGDLFQLLDRNDKGFSDYPITADADMKKQLKGLFEGYHIEDKKAINALYDGRDVIGEVLNGDILLLPNNLYIWATMNTSDQSLFPIDSAFKRRWNWRYIPISNRNEGYKIAVNSNYYDWWEFLEAINAKIWDANHSEDKKLGYFFAKADGDNIIDADLFVGKVIFYLWNDVFKDFIDESGDIFNDEDGSKLSFDKFYETLPSGETKVVEKKAEQLIKNLGLEPITSELISTNDDVNTLSVIKVNGIEVKKINAIPYTAIEEYVRLNSDKSAQDVIDVWAPFKKYSMRSWIVANKQEIENMDARYANYSYEIKCSDGNSLWVNKDGWMHNPMNQRDTIREFIEAVNEAGFGINITEDNIV